MRPEYEIAEAIAEKWHAANRGGVGGLEIPLGVVATILLTKPEVAAGLAKQGNREFLELSRNIWAATWLHHPHLATEARPISSWLDQPTDRVLDAARAVAKEAMRQRVKSYQGVETDLLGALVVELRSPGSRKALAEHPTPPDVSKAFATMLLLRGLPEPGKAFVEPTSGSGGTIRAIAERILELGGRPEDYVWHMNDLDPIVTAVAAVNAMVWNLGPAVFIHCGDILQEGDSFERAVEAHTAAVRRWAEMVTIGREAADHLKAAMAIEKMISG